MQIFFFNFIIFWLFIVQLLTHKLHAKELCPCACFFFLWAAFNVFTAIFYFPPIFFSFIYVQTWPVNSFSVGIYIFITSKTPRQFYTTFPARNSNADYIIDRNRHSQIRNHFIFIHFNLEKNVLGKSNLWAS